MPSCLCLVGVLLCAPNQVQAQPQSLYELISSNADLLLLKEALDVAGLNGTLQDPALTYTAFAPTNDVGASRCCQSMIGSLNGLAVSTGQGTVHHAGW